LPQIVFRGRSLVPSENFNPFDHRFIPGNYGSGLIARDDFDRRGLVPTANLHDVGGSWWQGEPVLLFFRNAVLSGELPFWDPFVGAGAPAFANLT
jgi:hypothetical protein